MSIPRLANWGITESMDLESAKELTPTLLAVGNELTLGEFASLLAVGNTGVNDPAPTIPAEHSARLVALGYMVDLKGRLRMTTPGRIRIAAETKTYRRPSRHRHDRPPSK